MNSLTKIRPRLGNPKGDLPRHPLRMMMLGAFAGFVLPNLFLGGGFLDFFQRLWCSMTGGSGESAVWGEPLFYLSIFGLPGALLGAVLAVAFDLGIAVIRSMRTP